MSHVDPTSACPVGSIPISGSIAAVATPMADGTLHLRDLDNLIAFQARHNTTGILVGGTVGEGWALSIEETGKLVGRAAEATALYSEFRQHVYAGVSEIDSRRARNVAVTAVHAGAEALFVTAPPLVNLTDSGFIKHVAFIAGGLPPRIPIVLLNELARTGFDIHPDLVCQLVAEVPAVAAHCEGIGQPARARFLAEKLPVPLLCSDDRMIGPYLRGGAVGAVTTVAGIVPKEMADLVELSKGKAKADDAKADTVERGLGPLIDALRIAPSPVALKEALYLLEALSTAELRAPLASLDETQRAALSRSLANARLLVPTKKLQD